MRNVELRTSNTEHRAANVQLSAFNAQRSSQGWQMVATVTMGVTFAVASYALELGAVWSDKPEQAEACLKAQVPPKALIVSVFEEGRAAFPTQVELFASAQPVWTLEQLREVGKQSRAKGVALYGALDLFHWVPLGKASGDDMLAKQPELMEVNLQRSCNEQEEGRFASPWNPKVRKSLLQLAGEVATKLDMLDGLVLDCRLTPGELLGYSDPARVEFILAQSLDPIDLLLDTAEPEEKRYAEEWYRWRLATVTAFFGDVVEAYRKATSTPHGSRAPQRVDTTPDRRDQALPACGSRAPQRVDTTPSAGAATQAGAATKLFSRARKHPAPGAATQAGAATKRVLVQALADLYRLTPRRRGAAAQDWLDWVVNGYVDGLLLEADWAADAGHKSGSYRSAADLLSRTGRQVTCTALVDAPSVEEALKSNAVASLTAQGCERIAVRIARPLAPAGKEVAAP